MTTLVTGATGTVGHAIVRALLARGRRVRALVRDVARARTCVPAAVELVAGDVTDAPSVGRAVAGCAIVYHASGLPEQWLPDPRRFDAVNVGGTRHLVEASLAEGVSAFLYTSTIDVFTMHPSVEFDERELDPRPKATAYERSKQEADRLVTDALARGLPARLLHPSGVYGPAPVTTGVNDFLKRLVRRGIPMLLPGGFPLVFADDVAAGHLAAEERAAVGARFILSESYWRLDAVARAVAAAVPGARVPPMLPMWVARAVSEMGELAAHLTRRPPLIPSGQLHFLSMDVHPCAARARAELDWRPLPFDEGLRRTLDFAPARCARDGRRNPE
ncbi:MAG: NAD-dependent epimerase/dehydratase family protein [Deltaproteobacteria bacterium]|nr:NAD-dependent epimerase/dehydratase family protein [Deltaproteobacteria bacterium]